MIDENLDEAPQVRYPKRIERVSKHSPWKTQYNALPDKGVLKPSLIPSMTTPDKSMSVAEMIRRHGAGLPMTVRTRVPMFDDDESGNVDDSITGINLETLDFAEREALLSQVMEEQKRIKAQYQIDLADRKQKAAAARQLALKKELEELQKAKDALEKPKPDAAKDQG